MNPQALDVLSNVLYKRKYFPNITFLKLRLWLFVLFPLYTLGRILCPLILSWTGLLCLVVIFSSTESKMLWWAKNLKSWDLECCLQNEDFLKLSNGQQSQLWRAAPGVSVTLVVVSLTTHHSSCDSPAVSHALTHMRGTCNVNFLVLKDDLIRYQRLTWSPEGSDLPLLKI